MSAYKPRSSKMPLKPSMLIIYDDWNAQREEWESAMMVARDPYYVATVCVLLENHKCNYNNNEKSHQFKRNFIGWERHAKPTSFPMSDHFHIILIAHWIQPNQFIHANFLLAFRTLLTIFRVWLYWGKWIFFLNSIRLCVKARQS